MSNERARELFAIYKAVTGRSIVPRGTKIENTYQWRYATKFISNMQSLGVEWTDARKVAYYAIKRAMKNKQTDKTIWSRGLWILTSKSVIDIACEDSKNDIESVKIELDKIRRNYNFARKNRFDFGGARHEGAYPNIVLWYDGGHISTSYLSLSQRCDIVMRTLDDESRARLPGAEIISNRRVSCFIDREYLSKVKSIMKDDFLQIT